MGDDARRRDGPGDPSTEVMDDGSLVTRAAAGDETAFELLVRRHTDTVWRQARWMLPDDSAAEEAVQDTFVKAYRALGAFRGDSTVSTWLHAICHRACLDRLRLKRAEIVSLDQARERRAAAEEVELRVVLEDALRGLPDDERQAFTLVHVLGHSRHEASVIAGVPPSTMRSRVSRARRRLADVVGSLDDEARAT